MKPPPVNPLGNSRHRDVGRSAYRNAGNSDYRALGKTAYRRWEALLTSSSVKNVTVYTEEHVHGPGCFTTIEVEDEESYPAQEFEGELKQIDDRGNEYVAMTVHAEAPEGAFPEGTTMQVDAVDEEEAKEPIGDALAQETTGKVVDLQLVDITFHDAEGNEIKPAKEITVNLASDLIAKSTNPYVVHINDKGDADVVETLSDDELVDRDLPTGDDQLTFDTESFSPYGVVVTSQDETLKAEGGETYDSITVEAAAAAGVPSDAELQVQEILEGSDEYESCLAQMQDAFDEEIGYVRFFDISIVRDGEDVQPQEAVDVKIDLTDVDGLTDGVQAVHYGKDGLELLNASLSGATVAFEADGFSVYAVVDGSTDDHARMKLEFYGADLTTPVATMYVKNGDTATELQEILYDPGAGTLSGGSVFSGWILDNENYTTADVASAMNIDEIREWAEPHQITEGETHKFYAAICKLYTITYKDDDVNGTVVGKEAVPVKASEYWTAAVDYTVRMAYTPKDDIHDFQGWRLDDDAVAKVVSTVPEDHIYQNDTSITIQGDVSFTVNAPAGHWLVFDENGKGATYNAPQFVKSNEVTSDASLNEMTRNGYTFGGWYDTKEHAEAHAAN